MPEHICQSKMDTRLTELLRQRQELMEEYIHLMDLMDGDISRLDHERLDIHSSAESAALQRLNALQRAIISFPSDSPVHREMEKRFSELNETAVQKILRNRSLLERALKSTGEELGRVRRARARTGRKISPVRSRYIDMER